MLSELGSCIEKRKFLKAYKIPKSLIEGRKLFNFTRFAGLVNNAPLMLPCTNIFGGLAGKSNGMMIVILNVALVLENLTIHSWSVIVVSKPFFTRI